MCVVDNDGVTSGSAVRCGNGAVVKMFGCVVQGGAGGQPGVQLEADASLLASCTHVGTPLYTYDDHCVMFICV